jgi:hypothetical protein
MQEMNPMYEFTWTHETSKTDEGFQPLAVEALVGWEMYENI